MARAYKLALRWTRNAAEADDLLGDALLDFVQTYDPERAAPYTHLVWRMRSRRSQRARSAERRRARQIVPIDETNAGFAPDISPETLAWLAQGIASLPDRYRVPVAMFLSGSDPVHIAARVGLSVATVRNYVFVGRAMLQKRLAH